MKKLTILFAALILVSSSSAQAAGTMGGLGFRTLSGPENALFNSGIAFSASPALGVRQWFSETVGADLAIGFTSLSYEAGAPTTKVDEGTGFVLDVGIPIVAKKWDKVNFIVRPGFQYGTATTKDKLVPTTLPSEIKATLFSVSGEFEVEYTLTERLSISASQGFAYASATAKDNAVPAFEQTLSGFGTTGSNFTQLGFHVYLW